MKDQTSAPPADVYVIPFSHLDLYWAGTREECLSRGNRIISRAIHLAERFPEFRFLLEDEVFVANYVESRRGTPEVASLKQLVAAGRIEISPKWAGIYQNLPRGEAHVRNLVCGKRYARQEFGVDPQVAHLGDLPGYTGQYPQILSRSGVPYMVMTRMGPPDLSLFHWMAPDGSRILAWHSYHGYGWGVGLGLHRALDEAGRARIASEVSAIAGTTAGPVFLHWGTDLWAPNETLIENTRALDDWLKPMRFRLATPAEFFRAAAETPGTPQYAGEIPSSWANILTSMAHIWHPTCAATDTLLDAETFAAINHALGYASYPAADLDLLWKTTLESMDHNNYGQGGEIGDDRKVGYAHSVTLRAGAMLRDSLRNIAERVQNPFPGSTAIVVFNPLSWRRDDVVHAHATLYGDVAPHEIAGYKKAMRLVDESGQSVPFHVWEYSENVSRALQLVFVARGVPSVGYKTYFLVPADDEASPSPACRLELDSALDAERPRRVVGAEVMENEHYRVSVDRATGRIEVYDKALGRTVARDIEISAAEERGGDTLTIEPRTGRTIPCLVSRVEVAENNAVRAVMRVTGDVAGIPLVQTVALYGGLKRVDIETSLDWRPGRFLKLEQVIPYVHAGASVRYGIPFGSADAAEMFPNCGPHFSDEVPRETWKDWRQIQDWVFVGDADWGLTLCADRQLITVGQNEIRIGMLRGTKFNPLNIVRDGRTYLHQQPPPGTYTFRYTLASGPGSWTETLPWRCGLAFSHPPIPVQAADDLSSKSLPPSYSFCSMAPENLVVTAIKRADAEEALIVRVCEMAGKPTETALEVLGKSRTIRRVTMLEEEASEQDQASVTLAPFEIATLRVAPVLCPDARDLEA